MANGNGNNIARVLRDIDNPDTSEAVKLVSDEQTRKTIIILLGDANEESRKQLRKASAERDRLYAECELLEQVIRMRENVIGALLEY